MISKILNRIRRIIAIGIFSACLINVSVALADQSPIMVAQGDSKSAKELAEEAIDDYVSAARGANNNVISTADRALDNFAERVHGASLANASNLSVLQKIGASAYAEGWKLIAKSIPGSTIVNTVTGLATNVSKALDEKSRAQQINRNRTVVGWIADQREILNSAQNKFRALEVENSLRRKFRNTPEPNKPLFAIDLAAARANLEGMSPRIGPIEKRYYEDWINAHFKGVPQDGRCLSGCIEIHVPFDDEGPILKKAVVMSPNGANIAEGFNHLRKRMKKFSNFLQINVHKHVCIIDPSLPFPGIPEAAQGFFEHQCGWLDANNAVVREPTNDEAKRNFEDPAWRVFGTFGTF